MTVRRAALIGAGVGFALGMPLFEVVLLLILVIDGGVFDAAYTVRYFATSGNVISLLVLLHLATALAGALTGITARWLARRRTLAALRPAPPR